MPASTEIQVSWSYPREAEESISAYLAFARYLGPCNEPASGLNITDDGSARSLILTHLQEGSDYEVVIIADALGEGFTKSPMVEVSIPSSGTVEPQYNGNHYNHRRRKMISLRGAALVTVLRHL